MRPLLLLLLPGPLRVRAVPLAALYSEHPEPECQRALRGGELPILGDNQESDDLESLGYRGPSLNYLPKLDPGIFRKYMN